MDVERTIMRLIEAGEIRLGMTKAQVREVLGPPAVWGGTSRRYCEPSIWKYGAIEFWFETRPGRISWPGPALKGVYAENSAGNGTMLLG